MYIYIHVETVIVFFLVPFFWFLFFALVSCVIELFMFGLSSFCHSFQFSFFSRQDSMCKRNTITTNGIFLGSVSMPKKKKRRDNQSDASRFSSTL